MAPNLLTLPLLLTILSAAAAAVATAQSPAEAPAPPGPTNVTKILEKAGQYTVLIKLLKATSVADQINNQLNNSNNGITIFAPKDNAFASLKSGTLNGLTNQQQVQLVQYHVVPLYLSMSQFQTVSNPVRTNAGDTSAFEFPLNVTTSGNSVNISTGLVNTTVANTIYTDDQLAVYEVDSVLLPIGVFVAKPPSPAPAPEKSKTKKKTTSSDDDSDDPQSADSSGAVSLGKLNGLMVTLLTFIGVSIISLFSL